MLEVFGVRTMPSYQQVMSPTHDSFFQTPPPATPMLRRRRMANGELESEQLALPPVEPEHPAGQELAVVEEVEKEKDSKEEEGK